MDEVVVSVDDRHLAEVPRVVARLRAAGMVVADVSEPLGTVTGAVARGGVERLATVPGVGAIERSRVYRLPPPDSPVQ